MPLGMASHYKDHLVAIEFSEERMHNQLTPQVFGVANHLHSSERER